MFQELADFRALFGSLPWKATDAAAYRWKIAENPFAEGHAFTERRDGQIVGLVTLTPKSVVAFGERLSAAQLGDGYTHPNYRRQGIFSRAEAGCIEHAQSRGMDLIYGDTTPEALLAEQKIGMRLCEHAGVRKLFKTVSLQRIEEAVRRRIRVGWAAKIIAKSYEAWNRRLMGARVRPGWLAITRENTFPEQIVDGTWGQRRDDFAFFTYRDARYLNWRFCRSPDTYETWIARDGRQVVGYLVTKLYRDGDKMVGVICDFATRDDKADILLPLLARAEQRLGECGAEYIHAICSNTVPYYAAFRRLRYRDRAALRVIVYGGTEIGGRVVVSQGKWHFTLGDSDNI